MMANPSLASTKLGSWEGNDQKSVQEQTCTLMDLGSPPRFVVDGILVQGQLLQILSQAG